MYISINDTRLFFDVDGAKLEAAGGFLKERETIVFLHGGPGFDHSAFKPTFQSLGDYAQLVFMDFRGNGRSDWSSSEYWTLDQWTKDTRDFCMALGIEKPILFGHSFGGFIAMKLAATYPDLPAKMILSGTAAWTNLDRKMESFEKFGGPAARRAAESFWAEITPANTIRYNKLCMPLYNQNDPFPDNAERAIVNMEVFMHFAKPGGEFQQMDLRPELSDVRCPTLILSGELDPITPVADAQDILQALPQDVARLEIIAGAGHNVERGAPDQVFELVKQFLDS